VLGEKELQKYLVNEIQEVYRIELLERPAALTPRPRINGPSIIYTVGWPKRRAVCRPPHKRRLPSALRQEIDRRRETP
jgi:hypothetical protein